MTARFAILLAIVLAGCSSSKPVSQLLHEKQMAQNAGFAHYAERSWRSASRDFQQAADILNALDDYAGEAAARHNQARALQHAGKLDDAIAAYQRALDINRRLKLTVPQSQNLAGLSQCYAVQGRLPQAIEAAEQALPAATTAKIILQNDLAGLLLQRREGDDVARARKLLDAALAADPKLPVTQLNLGRAALADGQPAAARTRLTQALESYRAAEDAAGIACAHEALARCCAALGERDDARQHLEQARQKFAFLKDAPALKRLDSIQP